ncbi:MAG: PEP-CTERM sorting domain-containing protein [Armatimonadetes bacterium]|nr:PEP-CTERM sorting domain-containing protein [Armatimonadota bacterium]
MSRRFFAISILAASALSQAQQLNFTGTILNENFNSLSSTGTTNSWTNGSSPLNGWYMETITGNQEANYRADTGASNSGALYSYGASTTDNERALGALGSGTPQAVIFGFRVRNMTGSAIDSFSIVYTGEQWRNGGNASAQTLRFSYKQDADNTADTNEFVGTDTQSASGDVSGTNVNGYNPDTSWTRVTSLDFTSPTTGTTAAALNGNDPINEAFISSGATLSSLWMPGQDMMFRFVHINEAGNDHGLAIDNMEFDAHLVPEPAGFAVLAIGLLALRRRK